MIIPFGNILSGLAAAGVAALGGLFTNKQNAEYNAREAQKDRDFQERMYNQQVQDNINFWKMQQDYNLPSAERQRIEDAGLSPLLLYGQGGVSGQAGSAPQAASAPSGSKASTSFTNPFETAQYLLLDAQRKKLNAETEDINADKELKQSQTRASDWQTTFNRLNAEIDRAIKFHQDENLQVATQKLRNDMFIESSFNSEQLQTLRQARMMEIKRFHFDVETMGEKLKQMWYDLKTGRMNATANLRNAATNMYNAVTQRNLANGQLGLMAQTFAFNEKMNPLLIKGQSLDNVLKTWDGILKVDTHNEKIADILNQEMRNFYLRNYGSEELFKSQVGGTMRDAAVPFYQLFLSW